MTKREVRVAQTVFKTPYVCGAPALQFDPRWKVQDGQPAAAESKTISSAQSVWFRGGKFMR